MLLRVRNLAWKGSVGGMSSRLTLLFLCDQADSYAAFLSEFSSASFQVLIARNIAQAEAFLQRQNVDGIMLRHDCHRDDRPLADKIKHITPRIPIFLLTDLEQPKHANIDSVWRAELGDTVVARAMAVFLGGYLQSARLSRPGKRMLVENAFPFAFLGSRPQG